MSTCTKTKFHLALEKTVWRNHTLMAPTTCYTGLQFNSSENMALNCKKKKKGHSQSIQHPLLQRDIHSRGIKLWKLTILN